MKSTVVRYMRGNLPAYVNGTLGSAQLWILERWLARDSALQAEVDELRGFRSIIQDQALINPDPSVLVRLKSATAGERVQPRVNWQPSLVWPMIIALLAVAAVLFWRALPPGLEISWSLDGPVPESFKVYRAPVDSSSGDGFLLIGELPAQSGVDNYGYTDLRLVPGQQFLYQVEAVDGFGNTVTSQALTGNSLEALPRQVFFLTIFVVICFALLSMLRQYRLGKSIPVHFAL